MSRARHAHSLFGRWASHAVTATSLIWQVGLGASIVNDVTGGARDPNMLSTVARLGVPAVLMHMRGDPTTMQAQPNRIK